jgi:hypothetical protein
MRTCSWIEDLIYRHSYVGRIDHSTKSSVPIATSARWLVDDCHALVSFETQHAPSPRTDTPAAATINIMIVGDSGTAALAIATRTAPKLRGG